ncbi:PREDICTED: odorant receptor 22c-like isoform X2 [Wasmannia auropunctata]|uniref:odorant receptor 22c-like isoform X2 n=1 Tax=Wasmannia auropunctata TaxID=64793 RepID=UPI0005EE99A8|nr:PREDICTED: odorant receptor 22c-like isoform X2 [Wasmannia auropunctata]
MNRTTRPKPSESDDEIGDARTEETGSFDHAFALTRHGMRLLGFWPRDTHLLSNLRCGAICALIGFISFPGVVRTYTVIDTVTDWSLVMHQAIEVVPMIPLLARFVFMKVMAKNFQHILHTITTDWADFRYMTKRARRIMAYYARRGRRFCILSTTLLTISIIGFMLTPVVRMWHSDSLWNTTTRVLLHEGLYFRNKESPVFEILYVTQAFVAFLGATAIATVDCFLYIIVFHVCGQFDILAAILKRYDGSVRHHPSDTKDPVARNCACIFCIVQRHVHILKYASIIEKSFRDFLLLQLLGYWVSLVLQGRELILYVRHSNIHGSVTCILYVLTIMYYIFIYCYVSECIIERSENIATIAHDLEWLSFPRDTNLPIIVARARIPCKLTAGRFLTLSFHCYHMILTTTISYISVLAAFK